MAGLFSGILNFSKRERQAVILLLLLIIFSRIAIFFSDSLFPGPEEIPEEIPIRQIWMRELLSADQQQKNGRVGRNYFRSNSEKGFRADSIFQFDPNVLTEAGWRKLGLQENTIRSIKNYLKKGGRFRRPEDLKKIYSLPEEAAGRLIPHVRIIQTEPSNTQVSFNKTNHNRVDINLADSAALDALPGIGPVLAARTIAYRNRLGGFYRVEQMKEVYGVSDSLFEKIKPLLMEVSCCTGKVRINIAAYEELARHPYIGKQKAALISGYRNQHGPFRQAEDLLKIMNITPDFLEKIRPYLDTDLPAPSLN